MTRTPAQALARADAQTTCPVGMCLQVTRKWYGIPARESSAILAWDRAIGRHTGRNAPPGAPVFYRGGRFGHIAIARSSTHIRSSDAPSNGRVGNAALDWPRSRWGHVYVGWAEGFNGVRIPGLGSGTTPSAPRPDTDWAAGDVWVDKLHRGQRDSDSVRRLQFTLNALNLPGVPRLGYSSGNFGPDTQTAVQAWQRSINNTPSTSIGPKQAARLFAVPPYRIR